MKSIGYILSIEVNTHRYKGLCKGTNFRMPKLPMVISVKRDPNDAITGDNSASSQARRREGSMDGAIYAIDEGWRPTNRVIEVPPVSG